MDQKVESNVSMYFLRWFCII